MANDSKGRYYAKNSASGSYADLTTTFNGLAVLKLDGYLERGKPTNIYTAKWVDSQTEDYMLTGQTVVRENIDLTMTFIIRKKYATNPGSSYSVLSVHDTFISFMTNSDIWLKSEYFGGKSVHCVCLKEYKPTTIKLGRGDDSFIMGTITLHTLTSPA